MQEESTVQKETLEISFLKILAVLLYMTGLVLKVQDVEQKKKMFTKYVSLNRFKQLSSKFS